MAVFDELAAVDGPLAPVACNCGIDGCIGHIVTRPVSAIGGKPAVWSINGPTEYQLEQLRLVGKHRMVHGKRL